VTACGGGIPWCLPPDFASCDRQLRVVHQTHLRSNRVAVSESCSHRRWDSRSKLSAAHAMGIEHGQTCVRHFASANGRVGGNDRDAAANVDHCRDKGVSSLRQSIKLSPPGHPIVHQRDGSGPETWNPGCY